MTDGQDLRRHLQRAEQLLARSAAAGLDEPMARAIAVCVAALAVDQPVMVCGNGGSAADAMHIAGELVGRFMRERRALNVIALSANPAVLTAWANDYDYASVFARQVEAHGRAGGVLLGLSTSGNSANVVAAFDTARRLGVTTIALTGAGGGRLAGCADILLAVPSTVTSDIQQVHLCLYHYLCGAIETQLSGAVDG